VKELALRLKLGIRIISKKDLKKGFNQDRKSQKECIDAK
jgi:hypothetical protein